MKFPIKLKSRNKILLTSALVSTSLIPLSVIGCSTPKEDQLTFDLPDDMPAIAEQASAIEAGKKVISYYVGDDLAKIEFKEIEPEKYAQNSQDLNDVYTYQVIDHKLILGGSSGVAFAHGFYDWVKANGYGMVSWGGEHNISLPETLINTNSEVKVISPYHMHYYLNPVSFGYTMPYWHEKEWIEYLNWLAIHGYDTSLALTGTEAVETYVFGKLGLNEDDLKGFFNSPALAPWQRMGNIASWRENPYASSFNQEQLVLQGNILNEMRARNITPIVQGFGGFVPKTIGNVPDLFSELEDPLDYLESTSWGGWPAQYASNLLDPQSEQFRILGTEFVKGYQAIFGDDIKYFLSDTFNEMRPPSEQEARAISTNIYNSIAAADPEAVWVTQGWMLVYQRGDWPKNKFAAFSPNNIPNDKMLIVDYANDYAYTEYYTGSGPAYRYYDGFNGKNWIYGSVPTMGGKSSMTGIFRFLAEGGSRALAWQEQHQKNNLYGFGCAMEGFENNQLLQEAIADVTWTPKIEDVDQWIDNYVTNKYKLQNLAAKEKAVSSISKIINDGGALSNFVDHPRPTYQNTSVSQGGLAIVENDQQAQAYYDLILAVKAELAAGNQIGNLLAEDLREWAANLIATELDQLLYQAYNHQISPNSPAAAKAKSDALAMLDDMDAILAGHPIMNVKRWNEQAQSWGHSEAEKTYYLNDAQNIITMWGYQNFVNYYAIKTWSGMISGYYKYKIEHKLDNLFYGKSDLSNNAEHEYVENQNFTNAMQQPYTIEQILQAVDKWFDQERVATIYQGSPLLLNFQINWQNQATTKPIASSANVNQEVVITSAGGNKFNYQLDLDEAQKEKLVSGKYMLELSRNSLNRSGATIYQIVLQLTNGQEIMISQNTPLEVGKLIDLNLDPNLQTNDLASLKVVFGGASSGLDSDLVDGIGQIVDGSIMFRTLY